MLGNHIQLLCRSLLAGLVAGLLALGALYASVLQYPANPPAVGDPDTINEPTLLWLASVVLGLVAIVVAVAVAKALATQDLHTVRIAGPAFAFLVVVGFGYLVLPSVDEAFGVAYVEAMAGAGLTAPFTGPPAATKEWFGRFLKLYAGLALPVAGLGDLLHVAGTRLRADGLTCDDHEAVLGADEDEINRWEETAADLPLLDLLLQCGVPLARPRLLHTFKLYDRLAYGTGTDLAAVAADPDWAPLLRDAIVGNVTNQLNVTDSIQTLMSKIDAITGTSKPSKKVRVATSTLATSSRNRDASRAGTSSPWTSTSYGRWARAAANDSTARQEVQSTRARPWDASIRETSSRSSHSRLGKRNRSPTGSFRLSR